MAAGQAVRRQQAEEEASWEMLLLQTKPHFFPLHSHLSCFPPSIFLSSVGIVGDILLLLYKSVGSLERQKMPMMQKRVPVKLPSNSEYVPLFRCV